MTNIFSVDYCYGDQERFKRELEDEEFDKAEVILKGIVRGSSIYEEQKRIILLFEGYRALYKANREKYEILGDVETINERLEILNRLEKILSQVKL